MPDGGAEDASFSLIRVGPSYDRLLFLLGWFAFFGILLFHHLSSAGERFCGIEHLDIVVELFFDCGPVAQALGDGICLFEIVYRDRFLGSVSARLETQVFEPVSVRSVYFSRFSRCADSVAMHGAVQIHSWDTLFMGCEDSLDDGFVADSGGAFVMDYDVITLGVIWVAVDG